MRQERRGVFETNSSSTHSVCITTERHTELIYPNHLHFRCDRFGWGIKRITTPEGKAAYLYASLLSLYDRDKAQEVTAFIMDTLFEVGVKCSFDEPEYYFFDNGNFYVENAYVDHYGEDDHRQFVDLTTRNKGRLLRYLFSNKSFVLTGNDNDDHSVNIRVDYPHEEYYKGN